MIPKKVITIALLITILLNPISISISQGYRVPYNQNQVSLDLDITLELKEIKEFNISITDENSSLTAIIEILDNSGPLWGFFIEKTSNYPFNHDLVQLQSCCTKYADHASVYNVIHILNEPNPNYILAFYDTHIHYANATHFRAIFLKGFVGQETTIYKNPDLIQSSLLYLILPLSFFIVLLLVVLQVKTTRKRKKAKKRTQNKSDTIKDV